MSLYSIAKGILNVVFKFLFRVKVIGAENIPLKGKVIICSNHVSLLDPITVAISVPRRIYFMAKKELFENKILRKLLEKLGAFPVDRESADLAAVKNSLRILKNENALGIFPEGTRVDKENIDNAKPGVTMISIKGKAPIIPIYIDTRYKPFKQTKVIIGEPIALDEYFEKKLNMNNYYDLSKEVMSKIYSLKNSVIN